MIIEAASAVGPPILFVSLLTLVVAFTAPTS